MYSDKQIADVGDSQIEMLVQFRIFMKITRTEEARFKWNFLRLLNITKLFVFIFDTLYVFAYHAHPVHFSTFYFSIGKFTVNLSL